VKRWLACLFGRHLWVEFQCEPECCGGHFFTFCLYCGQARP